MSRSCKDLYNDWANSAKRLVFLCAISRKCQHPYYRPHIFTASRPYFLSIIVPILKKVDGASSRAGVFLWQYNKLDIFYVSFAFCSILVKQNVNMTWKIISLMRGAPVLNGHLS